LYQKKKYVTDYTLPVSHLNNKIKHEHNEDIALKHFLMQVVKDMSAFNKSGTIFVKMS